MFFSIEISDYGWMFLWSLCLINNDLFVLCNMPMFMELLFVLLNMKKDAKTHGATVVHYMVWLCVCTIECSAHYGAMCTN